MDIPLQAPPPPAATGWSGAKTIVVIVLLVLIGGGAFFGYRYLTAPAFTPEQALKQMLLKLSGTKSVAYLVNINAAINSKGLGGKGAAHFKVRGTADWHDLKNFLTADTLSLVFKTEDETFNVNGKAELRVSNKIGYLKLTRVPSLGIFDLSKLKDQWIKIELKDTQKIGLTETALSQVADLFQITKVVGTEKFKEGLVYHLKVLLNKASIKKLARDLSVLAPSDKQPAAEEWVRFDQSLDNSKIPEIDLWLGANDALPYKLTSRSTLESSQAGLSGEVSTIIELSDYNKPVAVEVPTETKTFEEALQQLASPVSTTTATTTKKASPR